MKHKQQAVQAATQPQTLTDAEQAAVGGGQSNTYISNRVVNARNRPTPKSAPSGNPYSSGCNTANRCKK